jgi:hypothetical protein
MLEWVLDGSNRTIRPEGMLIMEETATTTLLIATLNELYLHEQEILRRLAERPDRQKELVCHPFRALAEVNVQLSDGVCRRLLKRNPALGMLSTRAYDALLEQGAAEQLVQINLERLFRR